MTTLDEFVPRGWREHGDDPQAVFDRFPDGVALVTEARHLPMLANLIVHVAGGV